MEIDEGNIMRQKLAQAVKYWDYIAPIMKYPVNQKEYNTLVKELNELLDIVGNDEDHRLIGLVDAISNLIASYEETHHPEKLNTGIDALKFLMDSHHLSQSDLTEIGSQGVVSEILNGKRVLNVRQIKELGRRFHVDPSTFIDED